MSRTVTACLRHTRGTAHPPMGGRPLCKYHVTTRAPACSRQWLITSATYPSHRLVKIVRFSSFLPFLLSLSSLRLHPRLFIFLSLCVFFLLSSLYSLSHIIPFPFLSFSLSACWGSGRTLHAVYSTDTYAISVLFLIHLFPLILLVSAAFLFYCCTCIPGALNSWSFIMGIISNVFYYTFHPDQLRSILQWLVLALDFERSCACAYG